MKNYYEILEVDKKASEEIIEKAYRTLAKRYHPDLQNGETKIENEEKMKLINEAYDVLSNDFKRKQYDEGLESETISIEEYKRVLQENNILRQQLNNVVVQRDEGSINNMSRVFNEEINRARQQAYQDAYVEDMKNRGYRIKYKHDFKYYLKLVGVLLATVLIMFLIYQIPIVKRFFQNLYEENLIFQAIVDVIVNTFKTGF